MTETRRRQEAQKLNLFLAILTGVAVEILVELTKPIAGLWFAPLREVWEDLFVLSDWKLVRTDLVDGFWLFAIITFLVLAILWVRRGAGKLEEVLSSRERQIAFLIAIFATGVFIAPHLHMQPDKPCTVVKSSSSR
jgi:hypothetical protein